MRGVALILAMILAVCMLFPAQAAAQTEVRVYWGAGIVIGGLSIFISFRSGDLSKNESDIKTVEAPNDKATLIARAITEGAYLHPTHYETPGTVTVLSW
jgi:hypothetical protein